MVTLGFVFAAVGLLFLGARTDASVISLSVGCNTAADGIPCCPQFTKGDNDGAKELFISAEDYKTNCIESCKIKDPTSTGVTESLKEKYSSGEGINKNKCWCEFGDANLDISSQGYQTCIFPVPSALALEKEKEYYNVEGFRCKDECELDVLGSVFRCHPLNASMSTFCSPDSLTTYHNDACEDKCSHTRSAGKFYTCSVTRPNGHVSQMPCSPHPDP